MACDMILCTIEQFNMAGYGVTRLYDMVWYDMTCLNGKHQNLNGVKRSWKSLWQCLSYDMARFCESISWHDMKLCHMA